MTNAGAQSLRTFYVASMRGRYICLALLLFLCGFQNCDLKRNSRQSSVDVGVVCSGDCGVPGTGAACETDVDCTDEHVCISGVCLRKLGLPCSFDQCASGFCVDGICCDSACDALCTTCSDDGFCGVKAFDDEACGIIDCDELDNECGEFEDLENGRCEAPGVCKNPNELSSCAANAELYDDIVCSDGDDCTVGDQCGGGYCSGDVTVECLALTDESAAAGVDDPGDSFGTAWGDYDGDGNLDLWVSRTNLLYRNNGDGTFSVAALGITADRGAAWADADNDGDLDLYTTEGGAFYDSQGDGTFIERTAEANLQGANLGAIAWLDVDADGLLDLFFPNGSDPFNQIRQNDGTSPVTFSNISAAQAGLSDGGSNGETCTVADIDNDGDIDIWYNDIFDGALYVNQSDGTFVESSNVVGLVSEIAVTPYFGSAFGDYDNDGDLDLFLGHPVGTPNRLFENLGGTFALANDSLVLEDQGDTRSMAWGDVDHDGYLDLLVGNDGAPNALFHNQGDGTFVDIAGEAGLDIAGANSQTTSASFADYDNDGDLDIYYANDSTPRSGEVVPPQINVLWRNELNDKKFLKIILVGGGLGQNQSQRYRLSHRVVGCGWDKSFGHSRDQWWRWIQLTEPSHRPLWLGRVVGRRTRHLYPAHTMAQRRRHDDRSVGGGSGAEYVADRRAGIAEYVADCGVECSTHYGRSALRQAQGERIIPLVAPMFALALLLRWRRCEVASNPERRKRSPVATAPRES